MMRRTIYCLIVVLLFPALAWSSDKSRILALYAQYQSYTDIHDSDGESQYLSADDSLNLDIRLVRIFILTLHGGQSADSQRTHAGLGFKVDLPGFFMIGGSIYDLIRRKKKSVNTSIQWKTYVIKQKGQDRQYVGNRFSFTTDILIAKHTFINLDLGLYSHQGNQFFSPSLGLGFEF